MTTTIIQFPGSNRDNDVIYALLKISGSAPQRIWHTQTEIPATDLIVIPGGFSYGDYLRAGAIAARSPVMEAVRKRAGEGVPIIGVCNGFQILTEAGLLPGALMRNSGLKFVCREVKLKITNARTIFSTAYFENQIIRCPVAHHDGNFFTDKETLKRIEANGQVIFRYGENTNPNGSINDIAGICSEKGNVLGMMPHPENIIEDIHGGRDGRGIFESVLGLTRVLVA
jgi:phosphoribosylformylglycinamidine synthase I